MTPAGCFAQSFGPQSQPQHAGCEACAHSQLTGWRRVTGIVADSCIAAPKVSPPWFRPMPIASSCSPPPLDVNYKWQLCESANVIGSDGRHWPADGRKAAVPQGYPSYLFSLVHRMSYLHGLALVWGRAWRVHMSSYYAPFWRVAGRGGTVHLAAVCYVRSVQLEVASHCLA